MTRQQIIDWALFVPELVAHEKLILLILALYANLRRRELETSVSEISNLAKLSKRQTQRILKSLAVKERITAFRRRNPDGSNLPNVYKLVIKSEDLRASKKQRMFDDEEMRRLA